jgi:imidazolonepropionase
MRLAGASYEEIARAGGGIVSTVTATRAADEERLLAAARPRLAALAAEGVTTIEIKSGYGLSVEDEARMLRVAGRLGAEQRLRVVRTFLGAHAVPPEFRGRQGEYVDLVCSAMLERVAGEGLADAVDAFGERIAFTPAEVGRVFEAAQARGLPVKLHADQLSDQGGAALAARFGALSADHLEYSSEAGIAAMAAAGTVAVLLPGAFHTLRERQVPPVTAMRREGVAMALATDCNPGSSPVTSLLLMMNMGCLLFGLTTDEALAAVTVNAARALGLGGTCGRLVPGLAADFVLWDVTDLAELPYRLGFNPVHRAVVAGEPR